MNKTYHPRGVLVHDYRVRCHPLYNAWADMKSRCNDPKCHNYHGRGITYCERWEHFANFAEDMWPKPFLGASLERKDNDKGYDPLNCTWADRHQQSRNRRVFKNNKNRATGVVSLNRGRGGFNARYDDHGVRFDIGNFDTIEEAVERRRVFIELYKNKDPRISEMLSKGNADRRLRRDSTTGVKGISTYGSGFMVRKYIDGKRRYLGCVATFDKALELLRIATL